MFREIFRFEVRTGLRKPTLYVYFGLLFLLTLSIGLARSGVFSTTRVDSNLVRNSALSVANILLGSGGSIFSLFFSVILISLMATAIQKDYQYNAHPLFFTKPVTKPGYFLGRFLGAFTLCLFVFSALPLGYWIGTLFGMLPRTALAAWIGHRAGEMSKLDDSLGPWKWVGLGATAVVLIVVYSLFSRWGRAALEKKINAARTTPQIPA